MSVENGQVHNRQSIPRSVRSLRGYDEGRDGRFCRSLIDDFHLRVDAISEVRAESCFGEHINLEADFLRKLSFDGDQCQQAFVSARR